MASNDDSAEFVSEIVPTDGNQAELRAEGENTTGQNEETKQEEVKAENDV